MTDEPCGLDFPHAAHWWFDGDHDPDNHWCPGVVRFCGLEYFSDRARSPQDQFSDKDK